MVPSSGSELSEYTQGPATATENAAMRVNRNTYPRYFEEEFPCEGGMISFVSNKHFK